MLVHSDENPSQGSEGIPHVKELALVGMGWKRQRPHVIALIDDDLFIYSAFPYNSEGMVKNPEDFRETLCLVVLFDFMTKLKIC